MTLLAIVSCLIVAGVLRHVAVRLSARTVAADHWFWQLYCETAVATREFPPRLPQYLLDEEQWYPPLFPLLLTFLPGAARAAASRWGSLAIDLIRFTVAMTVVAAWSGCQTGAVLAAGLVYATTPILVSYNVQINPRGLGALWLDATLLSLFGAVHGHQPGLWIAVAGFSGLVLLTHKMSTQLLWFVSTGLGLLVAWQAVLVIPLSIAAALAMSGGFYIKVAIAHWDIVTFWNRNWPWLQADPVKESPIYGVAGYESPTRFYQRGVKGFVRHWRYLGGYAPSVWCALVPLVFNARVIKYATPSENAILWWYVLVVTLSLATVFVGVLRSLGSGYFYLYNAAFPAAMLWAVLWAAAPAHTVVAATLLLAIAANTAALIGYYGQLRRQTSAGEDLDDTLQFLRSQPPAVVMCLPPQLYDTVAYQTGHAVLFGGHGYGFRRLEPVFPRLLLRLDEAIEHYRVAYLLARQDCLPAQALASLPSHQIRVCGKYVLYTFVEVAKPSTGTPESRMDVTSLA